MKLNLGCGTKKIEGYVNVDCIKEVKPDIVCDLEKPMPFKDESADEILCDNVLEHIEDAVSFIKEIHRIAKKDARIIIRVPYYRAKTAYSDITHKHFFTENTFRYFTEEFYKDVDFKYQLPLFHIKKQNLKTHGVWGWLVWLIPLEIWREIWGFLIKEIEVELVKK